MDLQTISSMTPALPPQVYSCWHGHVVEWETFSQQLDSGLLLVIITEALSNMTHSYRE